MRDSLVLLVFGLFCAISSTSSGAEAAVAKGNFEKYSSKFDDVDVDSILKSRRLVNNYVNCLLEKGPCTPEGRELKKYAPEALATECIKCTDVQKKTAGKIFSSLLLNYREQFDALLAKYDPEGNYKKKYENADADYDYSNLDEA